MENCKTEKREPVLLTGEDDHYVFKFESMRKLVAAINRTIDGFCNHTAIISDYYQHLRTKDAARLLRWEKLPVSKAGYRMGFENLSHFSRVFEKHIGKKPKIV